MKSTAPLKLAGRGHGLAEEVRAGCAEWDVASLGLAQGLEYYRVELPGSRPRNVRARGEFTI